MEIDHAHNEWTPLVMRNLTEYISEADELIAKRLANCPVTISATLQNTSAQFPKKEALIFESKRLSYQELEEAVESLAVILQSRFRIQKGDRMAILLPNSSAYAVVYLAAARLGAINVTLNTRCRSFELEYMLKNSQPKLLITHPDFLVEIGTFAREYFRPDHIVLVENTTGKGLKSLTDLLKEGASSSLTPPEIKARDIASLMYTSGTTGRPKAAMISHANIIANSVVLSVVYLCTADDVDLILAPLFHATGLFGQLMRSIYMGSTCVVAQKFKSETALKTIQTEQVSVCVAVPTIFWLMLVDPDFETYELSSLTRIIYGGAPASENFIRQIQKKFPQAVQINAYGLTECTSITSALPFKEAIRKIGSIGLPTPLSQIRIVDGNDNAVGPNTIGELLIKSPQVCPGYWANDRATAEKFKNGWLYTGDLAKQDEEGFIFLMDRKKDMIIRGGENIYTLEVENVLYSHPKVLEAAVVGVADEIFGEQVKAGIVLKTGEIATAEEIRRHCQKFLADYKIPKFIEFFDVLPRNPAGKVIKEKLL